MLHRRRRARIAIFFAVLALGLNIFTGTALSNGANDPGPYEGSCDESDAGGNGQEFDGNGKATGKPSAGCVGKADDKNPPGQLPGGSDPNVGYECDPRDRASDNGPGEGNHGIGDTNPAHTGCQASSTGTPPPGGTTPGGPVTSGSVLGGSETITPPNAVLGEVLEAPRIDVPIAAPAVPVLASTDTAAPGQLAFTGVGAEKLAALGFALLLAGFAMIRLTRRPSVVTLD
jgi:hypothetical protein